VAYILFLRGGRRIEYIFSECTTTRNTIESILLPYVSDAERKVEVVQRSSISFSSAPTVSSNGDSTQSAPPRILIKTEVIPEATKRIIGKSTVQELKVLYADDNTINQRVLKKMLERMGVVNIDLVYDGQKAVDIEKKNEYDIVFMDIQMPVMDGLEACKHIVSRNTKAKVIFVTAHVLDEFRKRANEAGGVGFLSKLVNLKRSNLSCGHVFSVLATPK
jgi:CheY-like chemotaxis protein